ncbi:MAG: electron transfer flavoprotein subunit alpha/FixB family protein [Clostridiaceae bacterium]|jgi:electron transfer flavoprotein alpha subunit|nr:electron transfer flavoprotein subunit alpha/FixB family protein [Bacillota bacterium]NLN51639.1 electron transfer flavoprotein subunit alpha/FixB family protein [Clostridiaceae bacterium]
MTKEYKGVYTFAEQVDGELTGVSLELLGKAGDLAADLDTDVTAILLGKDVADLAKVLVEFGADRVILYENDELELYTTEPYTQVVAAIIEEYKPEILLIGATAIGRDLGPRIAGRVHTGLTADCTKLDIQEESKNLLMTRPAFGGNLMAEILCENHRPQMATVRPGVMVRKIREENRTGEIINFDYELERNNKFVTVEEVIKQTKSKIEIQDADILISGGRGLGGPENFAILQDLAEAIGGEVSGSRAAVDSGWIDKDVQVGQTGKTVRPTLYFAIGISGAIQHMAGMEESDYIIAINKDPNALIFNVADVGIVGDLFEIVPKLTESIKAERAKQD